MENDTFTPYNHRFGHNEEDAFFLLIYRLGGSMYYDHTHTDSVDT